MPAQIFFSLSERHVHSGFQPSDVDHASVSEVLSLVVDHADYLPRRHRQQAPRDTALLLVGLPGPWSSRLS